MANHRGRNSANMGYRWTAESLETLQRDPNELLKLPHAPVDLEYYALRDIAVDEELTIDYGEDWVNAWANYVGTLLSIPAWQLAQGRHNSKFRHPIVPVTGLIPNRWNDWTCVGESCERIANKTNDMSDIVSDVRGEL